jgi:hypothetical protein
LSIPVDNIGARGLLAVRFDAEAIDVLEDTIAFAGAQGFGRQVMVTV